MVDVLGAGVARAALSACVSRTVAHLDNTGGVNISVRVAKRPFAPTAPERRSAATEYLMGVYTTRNNYCELTALKFRRPIALLSWKTTQTGRADSIAPGHRHIGHFA